jgi:hypothetical protein
VKLPSEDRLQYVKLLAETLIALIILPLIAFAVLRDPAQAADKAIGKRAG